MKILVQGINYSPELTGIGKYTAEMCEWLASRGHQVTVITAMPYYPAWKVHPSHSGKLWHSEVINGVKVLRAPLYVPGKVTGVTRIIHEFSFAVSSLPFWVASIFKKHDVIISICPPFHLGLPGLFFGFLKRTPIVYHIQDLQVDAARRLNLIKSQSMLNLLEKMELFILKHVDKVSSISEGMKKNILKKGIDANKYISLPNWVDVEFIQPLSKEESLRKQLGLNEESKIILYSGNMGEKQGLEMILDAAVKLRHLNSLQFLMIGEGASKDALEAKAKELKLDNVKFLPLQPYNKLSSMLATADLHLVLQKKAAADLVLPSKFMTILAAGGIAIVTAEPGTTLYDLVKDHHLGILIPPENINALVNAIEAGLIENTTVIKENARNYAVNKLSIHQILTSFENDLFHLGSIKNG